MDLGKGKGTGCHICKKLHDSELSKKDDRIFAFFVDLKAEFDKMDKQKRFRILEELGINKKLREEIRETYRGSKNVVKVGEQKSKEFYNIQGEAELSLSSTLFNVYIADLEREMRKVNE